MSQTTLLLEILRSGPVHSHDLRVFEHMGDPSRRVADLREKGWDVSSTPAKRGDRPGRLYKLVGRTDTRVVEAVPDPRCPDCERRVLIVRLAGVPVLVDPQPFSAIWPLPAEGVVSLGPSGALRVSRKADQSERERAGDSFHYFHSALCPVALSAREAA